MAISASDFGVQWLRAMVYDKGVVCVNVFVCVIVFSVASSPSLV